MSSFIFITAAILAVFAFWKIQHNKLAELDFRHDLFKLRDRLRMAAITGLIDKDHPAFKTTDLAFCNMVKGLENLTLFNVIFTARELDQYNNEEYVQKTNLINDYKKQNAEYNAIIDEYSRLLFKYLLEQHSLSIKFIIIPVAVPILKVIGIFQKLRNHVNTGVNYKMIFPIPNNVRMTPI